VNAPSADGCLPATERRPVDRFLARAYDLFLGQSEGVAEIAAPDGDDAWGSVAASVGLMLWEMRVRDGEVEVRRSAPLLAYWADVLERPSLPAFDAAIHPKDRQRVWVALEHAVTAGAAETEVRVRALDGRQRWLRMNTVAGSDGEAGLVLRGAVFDVTAQRGAVPGSEAADALPLTARQLQVLQLTGEGATAAEIADRLHLSRRTVENHVARAMRALGVRRKRDAVALARERGMLQS
jgi:DNA-binding CsgD family transcriptional regulator